MQADEFYCLAFYHKGKIHRMLAGYDVDKLENAHLVACEASYKAALELNPNNPAIHSSLGYLYNDMAKYKEALHHHELANQLHPNYPDYIHGIAYAYFNIEKQNFEEGLPIDKENLIKADEAFERTVQLFTEFQTENSRVFLDWGKLKNTHGKTSRSTH